MRPLCFTDCMPYCVSIHQICTDFGRKKSKSFHSRHESTVGCNSMTISVLMKNLLEWCVDDMTMTSRRRLWSSTSHRLDVPPVRLSTVDRGASVFWCHGLERPASPRRICAVTRGFQTTTQDLSVFSFLPRHYHMNRVLLLPFITTVWSPVVLAIINII